MTRKYSSISTNTALASAITNTATSMLVSTGTASALLGGVTLTVGNVDTFSVAIDPDTSSEEIVFITAVSGDTFTIVRGRSGSTAVAHSAGAVIKHVLVSADLDSFESTNNNAVTTSGVATLTNKTIDYNANTITNLPTTSFDTTINPQTGTTYTLVLTDKNKLVTLSNAAAITLTVPPNSSVALATGSKIYIQQIGAGQVTVAAGAGVTITGTGTKLRTQYSAASLLKTGTDTWTMLGDIV